MESSINKKVTTGYLLKFSMPTIISMLLMSLFGIVDGVFVSRIIDPIALSAVGIVFPFLTFALSVGFMLGTGGNALVAKKIGEGREKEARTNFTLISLSAFIVSVVLSSLGLFFPDLVLRILGADDFIRPMALEYMEPLLYFAPVIVLGIVFQQFLITEGKAHIITISTVVGGAINIGLNFLLIYVLEMGLRGAAIATSVGYTIAFIVGMFYFTFKRKGLLYFVRPKFDWRVLVKSSTNGASEMVAMLATSITSVLMNNVLIRIEGPEAVAAAGIMFAGMGILTAFFFGYTSGIAPIISYNFGKKDTDNLKRLYSASLRLVGVISLLSIALGWLLTDAIINIYDIPPGTNIRYMAFAGLRIITLGFTFMGFNAFASMMFTALNNGKLSAILSFFRTLVFVVISFMVLPELFGLTGAWVAIPFAELLAIAMSVFFLKKMKKVYNYA